MTKSIRVKALSIKGRKNYVLRWKDPATNAWREAATDIANTPRNRTKAAKAAAEKEAALAGERTDDYTWREFEERYLDEWLSGRRPGTRIAWETATTCLRTWLGADPIPAEISADLLHRWAAWMRRQKYSAATIKSYLGILRAGLNWACDVGILASVPRFPRIRAAAKMGGRPITTEEFERMLAAVPKVRKTHVEEWRRFLRGLWLSGLRVSEAIALSWEWSAPFAVDLDLRCFVIRAQKSGKAEHAPMTPDFVAFLEATPPAERCGAVFGLGVTPAQASRMIGKFGRAAGVVTTEKGDCATAHDLRRSFGTRWASRTRSTAELQRLMRHADIHTTATFYLRLDAADLASRLAAHDKEGEKTGESRQTEPSQNHGQKSP